MREKSPAANVLIIAAIRSKNLGDQAIFLSLKNILEREGIAVDALDLTLKKPLTDNRGIVSRCFDICDKAVLRCCRYIPSANQVLIRNYIRHFMRWIRFKRMWKRKMASADVVIFGGGALLQDQSLNFPLHLYSATKLARALGRPYVFWGVSCGRFFSDSGKRLLQYSLDSANSVYVRNREDIEYLNNEFNVKAEFMPDPALFISSFIEGVKEKCPSKTVGINIVGFQERHNLLGNETYYNNYIDCIIKFIHLLEQDPSVEHVILFSTGKVHDYEACKNVESKVNSNAFVTVYENHTKLCDFIKLFPSCQYIVATRLHAAIMSLSYRKQAIGIAYDCKVHNFFVDSGNEQFCVDFDKISVDILFDLHQKIGQMQFDPSDSLTCYRNAITKLRQISHGVTT